MTLFAMRTAIAGALTAAITLAGFAGSAAAQQRTVVGERYVPTVWIDPDGCEHWVMDDGAEGFMSPHLDRKGNPVCHRGEVCGVMPTDQFFATNRHQIHPHARQNLENFFRQANARAFLVHGHTDSRGSDESNMALSLRRANAVAAVGQSVGARVIDIRGFGERMPRASNSTAEGMAQNRRVDIICIR
jgi:outer membrane protein OmpA-like peptidoglycan-associated protein